MNLTAPCGLTPCLFHACVTCLSPKAFGFLHLEEGTVLEVEVDQKSRLRATLGKAVSVRLRK